MDKHEKTLDEINEKIEQGSARVVTATEMKEIVTSQGAEGAAREVDVVTTGTFGAMCSSGIWMNFGHSEPPMKMSRVWLNDVEAYSSVAAVDAYLGATQGSETLGIEYGGGHVIEDLLKGRPVHLRAEAYGTDCYPRRELSTEITLDDLNQAVLFNPRNCYERYGVATNSTDKTLYTYMGKLLPRFENATFSGAGGLSPIINDPTYRTVGVGTRIFLGGGTGYITGSGTQHNPVSGFGTLMVHGDLKGMDPDFIRGATMTGYGCTVFMGVGVPIPVLDAEVAERTGVKDEEIVTSVYDYGVPSRDRPSVGEVDYAQLKSGAIEVGGQELRTSSVSSLSMASEVAERLRQMILDRQFYLSEAVDPISTSSKYRPMPQRAPTIDSASSRPMIAVPNGQFVYHVPERCVSCGLCMSYCEAGVFSLEQERVRYDPTLCVRCGQCRDVCPHRAISLRS